MELLAKQPKDRPASAADVMDRLRRIPLHETARPYSPPLYAAAPADQEDYYAAGKPLPDDGSSTSAAGNWLYFTLSMLLAVSYSLWYFS
jgi:hypothetical protein